MTVTDDTKVGSSRPAKVAFASFVGTAIEWYDFFIFGTAAALVFGVAFFPTLSPMSVSYTHLTLPTTPYV